jgi:archaemetzincin
MKVIHLGPRAKIDLLLVEKLRSAIPQSLKVACQILPFHLDPSAACHAEREQFHSLPILERIETLVRPGDWRLLAIADVDLYIPILKFVFGEAQMGGRALRSGVDVPLAAGILWLRARPWFAEAETPQQGIGS